MEVFISDHPCEDPAMERGLLAIAGMRLRVYSSRTGEALTQAAAGAHVMLAMNTPLSGDILHELPKLGLISVPGEDYSHVDVDAAKALGIWVCNVPGDSLSVGQQPENLSTGWEETRRLSILNILAWCTQGRPYEVVCVGRRLPPPEYRQPHLG